MYCRCRQVSDQPLSRAVETSERLANDIFGPRTIGSGFAELFGVDGGHMHHWSVNGGERGRRKVLEPRANDLDAGSKAHDRRTLDTWVLTGQDTGQPVQCSSQHRKV